MLILAGILLVGGTLAFVVSPLVSGRAAPLTDGPDLLSELRELYALRDAAYETLRDLEFDLHAGKIGEADYRELSLKYRTEAVGVVTQIDALEARIPSRGRKPGRA
jgi:hypothetical protein